MLAAVAAIIVFLAVAPMSVKDDHLSPALEKGDVVIVIKDSYHENQPPEEGLLVAFKVAQVYDWDKESRFGRIGEEMPSDQTMENIRGYVALRIWPFDRFGKVE
jgi:hypothetical protein